MIYYSPCFKFLIKIHKEKRSWLVPTWNKFLTWEKKDKCTQETQKGCSWFFVPSCMRCIWMRASKNKKYVHLAWFWLNTYLKVLILGSSQIMHSFKKTYAQSGFILVCIHSKEVLAIPSLWDVLSSPRGVEDGWVLGIAGRPTVAMKNETGPLALCTCSFWKKPQMAAKPHCVFPAAKPGSRRLITQCSVSWMLCGLIKQFVPES